jgi:dipeptide/tripeptide permease
MYNKHLYISLVAILIIIYFAFYSIDVQNSSSQISSFSQNNNDVDEIKETEELKNAQIQRFPKAIIIGSPKCGNKIIKQNNFNIECLNSRHKWVTNTNWYSSKDQTN